MKTLLLQKKNDFRFDDKFVLFCFHETLNLLAT